MLIPPPDLQSKMLASKIWESSSRGPKLILISSLMAAWGYPPVCNAQILLGASASFLTRNSPSSFMKMSFITCPHSIVTMVAVCGNASTNVTQAPL